MILSVIGLALVESTQKRAADRASSFPMDVDVAKANIEHFKKLLETETNAQKRAVVERLLAEEELKLAALKKKRTDLKKD